MTKQVTLHYTWAVWRICYHRWVCHPAQMTALFFFFFSFLVQMCLIFRFVEFEIQWYVAGLLKWNELDGKKAAPLRLQVLEAAKWPNRRCAGFFWAAVPDFLDASVWGLSPACQSLPLVLSLSCWKAETEQKKILRRWLGQSQLTRGCTSIWCRCLHTSRHHAWTQYLQMCASDPAVPSILIHSYTEQRDRWVWWNDSQQKCLQIMIKQIELEQRGWGRTADISLFCRNDWTWLKSQHRRVEGNFGKGHFHGT